MRGADVTQESLFTVAKLAHFVPASHLFRSIWELADEALGRMGGLFSTLYAETDRTAFSADYSNKPYDTGVHFAISKRAVEGKRHPTTRIP